MVLVSGTGPLLSYGPHPKTKMFKQIVFVRMVIGAMSNPSVCTHAICIGHSELKTLGLCVPCQTTLFVLSLRGELLLLQLSLRCCFHQLLLLQLSLRGELLSLRGELLSLHGELLFLVLSLGCCLG